MTSTGIRLLPHPELIDFAHKNLPTSGTLRQNSDGFTYLKISDEVVFKLFPFISAHKKQMPDYFSSNPGSPGTGAHISVIYTEEWLPSFRLEGKLGESYSFQVESFFEASLNEKTYLGCTISSPELALLRKELGLPELLAFRGIHVPFHFTLAFVATALL